MSTLNQRILDALTAIGTDIKLLRTYTTGSSTGDLTGLTTTAKTSVVAAINEVKAAATGAPPAATTSTPGVAALATQTQVNTGTDNATIVTPLTYATRLAAYAQPLSANLNALASQAQQAYGLALLNVANQAALLSLFPATSDTVASIQRNATQTEVNAGTSDTTQVTPLKMQTRLAAFAVPLTYLDTDGTLAANSDTKVATQRAVKTYADALIGANDAMVFKGVIDASASPNYPAGNRGDTYKISVAGKIGGASGTNVEVGDTIICITDSTVAGTQAAVGAQWNILQSNIDGAVTGPAASGSGNLPAFNGTTGKVLSDSGIAPSTDGTMAANVDTKLPTEKAVKTYLGANYYPQSAIGNPDYDLAAFYATAKS